MLESTFQSSIKRELKDRLPGCIVIKNDPTYIQGIPDLTILWRDKWATLETKKDKFSPHQPNQDYYVNLMNEMSFSSFIFPDKKDDILDKLEDFMKK